MLNRLPLQWQSFLFENSSSLSLAKTLQWVASERERHVVLPSEEQTFAAFQLVDPTAVKVVILGQDPYPTPGHANGLCFSVPPGTRLPHSLQNIFKAINHDYNEVAPRSGDLTSWAEQGVLLMNCILTVRAGQPSSHDLSGWINFTDFVIAQLSRKKQGIVFLLWGNFAQSKQNLIDCEKHLVLKAPHPSPLSAYRGFLTCNHFKLTNAYLNEHSLGPINWSTY